MSQQQHIHEQTRDESIHDTGHHPPATASNASMVNRAQAIQQLNTWLEGQQTLIESTSLMLQQAQANGVLQAVENAWVQYEQSGYMYEMPATVGRSFNSESAGIFLPTELASNIRPFIEMTEMAQSAQAESSSSGVDWNTRLGIPEYRTQSDNLAAPEASCNVTTLAMVLERMGIGRNDILAALESQMDIGILDSPESKDADWLENTMSYLNRQMRAQSGYQRIRGEASMSNSAREGIASNYRENAQMEDLLDLLVHELGQSRTSAVSEPDRILEAVSMGRPTPTSEKLWERRWTHLAPQVRECIENGGAAALSFKHKGTRHKSATHIVSILAVEDDGFRIDDPYGEIRSDYNRNAWDDAYWGRDENNRLIGSRDRSDQQNVQGEIDDWGTTWARDLPQEEERGRESFITIAQVRSSMNYVQLFHRGQPSLAQPDGSYAPPSSLMPVSRPNDLSVE